MTMDALIFDMDGVIVDSEYTYLTSKTEMLNKRGYDVDESYQYQFMGTTYEYMWTVMKEELKLPLSVDEYIEEMNQRRELMIEQDGVRAIKDAVEFIRKVDEFDIPLAVASSSPKDEIKRNLEELNILDLFDVVISGEEVENSKPKPDIYIDAAQLLGVSPENCVAIEDTKNGSLSAVEAGMYCIGFSNPDYPEQDLKAADEVVNHFKEINIENLFNN